MSSHRFSVPAAPGQDRTVAQPRRRYVSENLDSTDGRDGFSPLGLKKPWLSVTKLFSSAHQRLHRTTSSNSSIHDDSSISMPGSSKASMLKTLTMTRQKPKHTVDNTCLQEFMQDVFHVMKHGTYPPAKGYATVIAELRQVLATPGGPDKARRAWCGHLLPRLSALLTEPIKSIRSLMERVSTALELWSNLQGSLAPLLQALWQPLPGMNAVRDAVTVFTRCVLPLVSLRGAEEGQRDEVLTRHRHRLVDMLLLCSRLTWCSEECCQRHNRIKDVDFEGQLLNLNLYSFASSRSTGGIAARNEASFQGSAHKHQTVHRKSSAPPGYLHFRSDIVDNIDEEDELVLQNHQKEHEPFHNSKDLENSLYDKETWRKTSCPAHLPTLTVLDKDGQPKGSLGEKNGDGFGGRTLHLQSQSDYSSTSNYNLSAELSLLYSLELSCGTTFILANLASLLRLHHEKE